MWRRIFKNNLKSRIPLIFSMVIFLTALLVSLLSYLRFEKEYSMQAISDSEDLLKQVSINVRNYLGEIAELCLSPYYSTEVMKQLEKIPTNKKERLAKKRTIEDYLQEVMIIPRKDIIRVYICADAIYSSSKTGRRGIAEGYKEEQWYLDALKEDIVFLPTYTEKSGNQEYTVLSVAKKITDFRNKEKPLGVIRVDANYSGIDGLLECVTLSEHSAIMILDSENKVLSCNSNMLAESDFFDYIYAIEGKKSGIFKVNGIDYFITKSLVENMDWKVVEICDKELVFGKAKSTFMFNMIIALLLSSLGVIASNIWIRKKLVPLDRTIELMKNIESGKFSVRTDASKVEEIKYLNDTFNHMVEKIQDMFENEKVLNKKVYEAMYLQKAAQMDSLYHQMQPHFLFNTLNTISILIKCNRKEDAVKSIEFLSILLRGVMNSNKEILVEDEIKITESYLKLLQTRYDFLEYDIRCEEKCLGVMIPALIIQPLAENAIMHGFDEVDGQKVLSISISHEGEDINICVTDNGIGIESSRLAELQYQLENYAGIKVDNSNRNGIALINLQKRIKIKYGEECGIAIESEYGKWTKVSVRIKANPRTNKNK